MRHVRAALRKLGQLRYLTFAALTAATWYGAFKAGQTHKYDQILAASLASSDDYDADGMRIIKIAKRRPNSATPSVSCLETL
jgi:hypothetical protein